MKIKMLALVIALSSFWAAVAFAAPTKAEKVKIAECNDGKTMYGTNPSEHRGACSGHGGVSSWADGSEVKSHAKKTSYSK